MISEKKQMRWGVFLSYIIEAVDIIVGLAYTPVMLRILGQSEYGLYQLVYSVVSYLSLIGLGFSSSYQRYYARAKNDEQDGVSIPCLNGMFLSVFITMSLICIVCGIFMIQNTGYIFGDGLTNNELSKANVLLFFMIFNMAITFPESLFTSHIISQKDFISQKVILLARKILNPFLYLPVLLLGYGSVGLVAISSLLAVLSIVANAFVCFSKLKMKISFKGFKFYVFKDMWGFTFFIFLNQIVNQINWSVDKFLLGRYCGTISVAIYSVGGQLRNYLSQFSTAISNVFIPQVNDIVTKNNDNEELSNVFIKVGRIQAYLIFLIVSGFIFFGKSFIYLWAGEGYETAYYLAVMLFLVLVVPYIQNLGTEIQRAKNKHRVRSVVYAIMAILNVIISIPLTKKYGVLGAGTGTVISVALCSNIFMNIYYHKYIGLNIPLFWKNILKLLPGMIIPILFGIVALKFINTQTWLSLLLIIVLYTVIYLASMLCLTTNRNEKKILLSHLHMRNKGEQ